jgi:hypothetical protein
MATEQSAAGRLELPHEWVAFRSVTYLNPKDLFNSLKRPEGVRRGAAVSEASGNRVIAPG